MKDKKLLQKMTEYVLLSALKKGASHVRVTAVRDVSNELTVLNNSLEKIQSAVESVLHIHLFVDGRYGTCSTNTMQTGHLDNLLNQSIASIKLLAPDPFRTLLPKELQYKGVPLHDVFSEDVKTEEKKDLLFSSTAAVQNKNPALINATAHYTDSIRWVHIADSNGLHCASEKSWFGLLTECSVLGENNTRPSDWNFIGGTNPIHISAAHESMHQTLDRALNKRNPKKARSGIYNVVVENRVASTLLAPVIDAISGAQLQQKNSFLLNSLGQRIGSSVLTLIDDPHKTGVPAYCFFDYEGNATKKRTVIEKGILNLFYLNTYHASKMQMPCTIATPSTLLLTGGKGDVLSLTKQMQHGIIITGFNGGNCNTATGDFSYGIEGFLVENGQITTPINEMVMTGNMINLWNQLHIAGDDAQPISSRLLPSLLFENIELAGL